MSHTTDVLTAFAGSTARLGVGTRVVGHARTPEKLLELYDFEACPFCRKAREALTLLDLPAMIYPCPKGGTRYRPQVKSEGGKAQFPYLKDPNTGRALYESGDIVDYLFETYGKPGARPPALLGVAPLANVGSFLASAVRPGSGAKVRPSRAPEKPLILYSFEASPFCRIVRETLCELEIAYELRNVGKGNASEFLPADQQEKRGIKPGTKNRQDFVAHSGKMMVPYLIDPNTGIEMFESADIKKYLLQTYGA
ncbi:MAG: glutathione S-transferase N-terminal domain-containing protein [Chrysiogenetes bacterium]|nr:glutathione S-transferase N-terminal domain-containing protein [Chrysiogenetes bacterium]